MSLLVNFDKKRLLQSLLVILVFSVAFWFAEKQLNPNGTAHWWSTLPPLVGIALAFGLKNVYLSLGAAIILGGILSAETFFGFIPQSLSFIWNPLTDSANLQILAFIVFMIMGLAFVLQGGGIQRMLRASAKWVGGRRSTQVSGLLLGLAVFVDDYANTWLVGSTMKEPFDKAKISREKLSFIVDATSAPIAGVALVSTWIGYELGLFKDLLIKLGVETDPYSLFLDALPYRFYCILMIIFVLVNVLSLRDFGPMLKAEEAALRGDDSIHPYSQPTESAKADSLPRFQIISAIVPLLSLIALLVWGFWDNGKGAEHMASGLSGWALTKAVLSTVDSIHVLAWTSASFLGIAFLLNLPLNSKPSEVGVTLWSGFKGALVPLGILTLAWGLKQSCDALKTHIYLTETFAQSVPAVFFPALVFVLAAVTAFATGTSFGTMAILLPTLVPLAFAMSGNQMSTIVLMSCAAVLDGAIFGDHCSPISDTTIMSSSASGCDHMAHVRTQLPYALFVAIIVGLLAYIPAAMGMQTIWVYLLSLTVMIAGFFAISRPVTQRQGQQK